MSQSTETPIHLRDNQHLQDLLAVANFKMMRPTSFSSSAAGTAAVLVSLLVICTVVPMAEAFMSPASLRTLSKTLPATPSGVMRMVPDLPLPPIVQIEQTMDLTGSVSTVTTGVLESSQLMKVVGERSLADGSGSASTSQLLSLQERRPPTKEEIEAKKRNFAFWFWGGGFVAPFLATFYYFG